MMDVLRTKLEADAAQVRADLRRDMRMLVWHLEDATRALEEGQRVPSNLIANYTMMTDLISRWNLLREILPCLEDK